MMDINADLLQWSIIYLIKKTSVMRAWLEILAMQNKFAGSDIKNEIIWNKELAKELLEPIIRNFQKSKLHSSFIYNIWGADLAVMQLISKFNKGVCFLLCVIYICSKHAWVIPLKDKKETAFQKILDEFNRKPNKIRVDIGSVFYNRLMKSWLENNDVEMYSTYNERKYV